jgi:hypothetical protein
LILGLALISTKNPNFEMASSVIGGLKNYRAGFISGCCPNENLFERSLKRFLFIILGEVKEKRFQLFEPKGRVLGSPGTSLRFIKKCFRASEK